MNDPVRFRVLPYEIEIDGPPPGGLDPMVRDKLRYLVNHAEQPGTARGTLRYRVEGTGPYRLFENDDALREVATPDDVLFVVYQRIQRWVVDHLALGGWSHLHAGLAQIGDHRFVLIGPKGRGKTTLSLRLLFDGALVEGDESVFVRDDEIMALPRPFHLKAGSELVVPELAPLVEALPRTIGDGAPIRAFDPALAGLPWRLQRGPIHAIVVLKPRSAVARVAPASTGDVLPDLLEQVFDPGRLGTPDRLPFALGFVAGHRLLTVTASTPDETVSLLTDQLIDRVGSGS